MVKEHKMVQTEIGWLPEDWEVVELRNVLKFGSGKDYKHLNEGDVPVYGTGGLMTYVDEFLYDGESVGIGRKGTIDKPVFLKGKFWTVDTLFFTHSFQKTVSKYIFYQFGRISWKEYNEASGVPSLNKNTLEQIQIPLPPLPEQEGIAEALSDADAWIESLEQFIAKKRLIKQGAMQELLTPGEDWEVRKLGDVGNIVIGLTYSPNEVRDFGTLVLRSSNIQNNKLAFENNVFVDMDLPERVIVKENDLLVCVRNGSKNLIGKCALIDKKTEGQAFGAFMSVIRSEFGKYLYHYFQTYHIQTQIDENLGATINQLTNATLKSFDINIPKSLTEQTRIATILSDMDAELEALEAQLDKARLVKMGMMQELLGGRVRLV